MGILFPELCAASCYHFLICGAYCWLLLLITAIYWFKPKLYFLISSRVDLLQVCLLFDSPWVLPILIDLPWVLPFLTDVHLGSYLLEIFGMATKFDLENLRHTEEKKFRCSKCPKPFKRKEQNRDDTNRIQSSSSHMEIIVQATQYRRLCWPSWPINRCYERSPSPKTITSTSYQIQHVIARCLWKSNRFNRCYWSTNRLGDWTIRGVCSYRYRGMPATMFNTTPQSYRMLWRYWLGMDTVALVALDTTVWILDPLRASIYHSLPEWVQNTKCVRNIQNFTETMGFKWSVLTGLFEPIDPRNQCRGQPCLAPWLTVKALLILFSILMQDLSLLYKIFRALKIFL